MLGLNFNHLGNGFSYLGHGTRQLRRVSRSRWVASFANHAQLINPLLSLSSTLKERVELGIANTGYYQGQLFFNSSSSSNLANTDFNAALFVAKQGAMAPFTKAPAGSAPSLLAAQLSFFSRLRLTQDLGFYLFLSLNIKPKFVLYATYPPLLHVVLFVGFPLRKLSLKSPVLRLLCVTKVDATAPARS